MTQDPGTPRTVLLTGAAGRIGSDFRVAAGARYHFRLADRVVDSLAATPGLDHDVVALDVADLDACRAACHGIDTVVHLAADPSPAADFYGSLLENNVKGTYNVFRAAQEQACRRVVFASSIHAVAGYPTDLQARTDAAVCPMNMYGVSKCFGEAVAACFAGQGLSAIAVRIGAYDAPWIREHGTPLDLSAYVSRRDLTQLLVRCIEVEGVRFAIVHGISDNRFKRLDLTSTRDLLGYAPEDDAFRLFDVDLRA